MAEAQLSKVCIPRSLTATQRGSLGAQNSSSAVGVIRSGGFRGAFLWQHRPAAPQGHALRTSSFTPPGQFTYSSNKCKGSIRQVDGRGPRCAIELLDSLQNIGTQVGQLPQVIEGLASAGTLPGVPVELLQNGAQALREFQALPQDQQVKLAGASGAGWLYLTARPGVVAGALDAYIAAPLQYVLDSIRGRKRYKRTDFVLGNRIGEGSFGTVYEGALVGAKLDMDDDVGARGVRLNELEEGKYKKVVLKKVKVGVEGAEECGQMEDWFNRRMQRYAPDMCAEYLGSFIADKTKGQFYKGGLWLVWNYQVGV